MTVDCSRIKSSHAGQQRHRYEQGRPYSATEGDATRATGAVLRSRAARRLAGIRPHTAFPPLMRYPPAAAERAVTKTPRMSELLEAMAAGRGDGDITIGEIVDRFGDRSFGVLILVLALPAWIPVLPPGVPSIFGIVIAGISCQMLVGREAPWLPDFVARRSIPAERFARLVTRTVPWLRRAELALRQRLDPAFAGGLGIRIVAFFCLLLALAVCIPLPMTNAGPALSLAVIALGLIERDGLVVLAGIVLGLLSFAAMIVFWTGAVLAISWLVFG